MRSHGHTRSHLAACATLAGPVARAWLAAHRGITAVCLAAMATAVVLAGLVTVAMGRPPVCYPGPGPYGQATHTAMLACEARHTGPHALPWPGRGRP